MSAVVRWLILACLVSAACSVLEHGPHVGAFVVVTQLLSLACLATMGYGIVRHRPPYQRAWWLLFCALAMFTLGDVVFDALDHLDGPGIAPGSPGLPDVFYLAGYPLAAGGLALMHHRRNDPHRTEGRIDTAIITASCALIIGVTLSAPMVAADHAAGAPVAETVTNVGYQLGDLTLVAMVTRLLIGRQRGNASITLLTASVLSLLAADVLYPLLGLAESGADWVSGVCFRACYILMAAAALHPSMTRATDRIQDQRFRLSFWRMAFLTTAVLTAPATPLLQYLSGEAPQWWVFVVGSAALFLLVIVRMAAMMRRLHRQALAIEETSRTDHLTGLPNRRCGESTLAELIQHDLPLSVALLDLDRFKAYNDSRGHRAGDDLLVACAVAWRDRLGPSCTVVRHGGEEFLVLMPGVDEICGKAVIEDLRAVMPLGQTFSAGVACARPGEVSDALLHRADQAMYLAKQSGRDRVVVWVESVGELAPPRHDGGAGEQTGLLLPVNYQI